MANWIKKIHPVDITGKKITDLAEWKKLNFNALYFDSNFERKCYLLLKEANFNFVHQPPSRELIPSFKTPALTKSKVGKKKVFLSTVRKASYTSDFLIYTNSGHKVYVEAKGFFDEGARMRYKLFQHSLKEDEVSFLVYDKSNSLKDMRDLIDIINEEYGGSTGETPVVRNKINKL